MLAQQSTKGQIEMSETILVLFVISIILALLILVYYTYTIRGIETTGEELSEQEALVQLASITKYPELRCTSENCIDMLKAISFKQVSLSNKDYYLRTFGKKRITVEQIYPEPKTQDECTTLKFNQFNYPDNCKYWVIYEEIPPSYSSKQKTSIPISIYFPELDQTRLGRLNIEVFR